MPRLLLTALACLSILPIASYCQAQYPAQNSHESKTPSTNWERLGKLGPGRDAIVTLTDGTLRGGWIRGVDAEKLYMLRAGEEIPLAASDIAAVRVMRPDRRLLMGMIGYFVTATVATVIASNEDDLDAKDAIIVFGVAGIPGGVLGAWLGDIIGGDVEIVP